MKLIRCETCNDVVRLVHTHWRKCDCGRCGGQYNEDVLSATVGGKCEVIGLSNLFFDKDYMSKTDDEKRIHLDELGHPDMSIHSHAWFGAWKGDEQIMRIESPHGPRLDILVETISETQTRSTIRDERPYDFCGVERSHVDLTNPQTPSFRDAKMRGDD